MRFPVWIVLYSVGWGLASSVSTASRVVTRRECDEESLHQSLKGPMGRRLAFFAGGSSIAAAISQLLWAIDYLKLYLAIVVTFFGLGLSGVLVRKLKTAELIHFGPPLLVFIEALLWVLGKR
jgi:hypothetical protein